MSPAISVIIRNRNEAESLELVLKALRQQDFKNFEVILVDNESADRSVEIARAFGAEVLEISDFTYGRSINLGVGKSRAKIIVLLSAHSIPLGRYFLTECINALAEPRVAAARLVYSGKGADVVRWLDPETLTQEDQDFISKGPLASGCVFRRSVWEKIPFDETVIAAEDKIWAEAVLRAGYSIVSPVPAFYYYYKRLPVITELHKNYKELVAVNRQFGTTLGFVNISKHLVPIRFLKAALSAFSSFVKTLRYEAIKAFLTLKFPRL